MNERHKKRHKRHCASHVQAHLAVTIVTHPFRGVTYVTLGEVRGFCHE